MSFSYNYKAIISGPHVEIYKYKKPIWKEFKRPEPFLVSKQLDMFKYEENRKKNIKTSVSRTRTEMRRLINSNPDLNKFVTLTYAKNQKNIEEANYDFNQFIKRLTYRYPNLKYIAVPEFQKRGAVHYHFLSNSPYIDKKELAIIWGHGFIKIKKTKKVTNMGAYMSKYLGKELFSGRMFRKKKYFKSQNFKESVELMNRPAQLFFDKFVNTQAPDYEKVFESEWIGEVDYKAYKINTIPFPNGYSPLIIHNDKRDVE